MRLTKWLGPTRAASPQEISEVWPHNPNLSWSWPWSGATWRWWSIQACVLMWIIQGLWLTGISRKVTVIPGIPQLVAPLHCPNSEKKLGWENTFHPSSHLTHPLSPTEYVLCPALSWSFTELAILWLANRLSVVGLYLYFCIWQW